MYAFIAPTEALGQQPLPLLSLAIFRDGALLWPLHSCGPLLRREKLVGTDHNPPQH